MTKKDPNRDGDAARLWLALEYAASLTCESRCAQGPPTSNGLTDETHSSECEELHAELNKPVGASIKSIVANTRRSWTRPPATRFELIELPDDDELRSNAK